MKNETLKIKIGVYVERWSEESKSKLLCDIKLIDGKKRANNIMTKLNKQINK